MKLDMNKHLVSLDFKGKKVKKNKCLPETF